MFLGETFSGLTIKRVGPLNDVPIKTMAGSLTPYNPNPTKRFVDHHTQVMVVLHHISAMHERGHTAKKTSTQPAGQAPEARPDTAGPKGGAGDGQGGGGGKEEATGPAAGGAEGARHERDSYVGSHVRCRATSIEVWAFFRGFALF